MRARVKYHIIYRYREEYPISVMCAFFAVSRSGYYAFVHRLDRPEKDAALAEIIAQQQERSFRTYGYRRMWLWLRSQNIFRDPKTVLRIMKKYALLSEIRRRRKWQQMGQQLHRYGNLLNRDFHADRPNHKWVTDISYIHTKQGRADNALLRELKAEIKKLAGVVVHTVSAVAERLEKLRGRVLIFCYQLSHIRAGRERYQDALHVYQPQMARYTGLVRQIKDKSRERKTLLAEKKALPAWKMLKHKELAAKIAELTEDLEELRSEKALLLQQFEYAEDTGAEAFRKDIAAMEAGLQKLADQEQKYSAELDKALEEYAEAKAQAAGLDPVELYEARLAIRDTHEAAAQEKIERTFGKQYSPIRWMEAKQEQLRLTQDSAEEYIARRLLKQRQKSVPQPSREKRNSYER